MKSHGKRLVRLKGRFLVPLALITLWNQSAFSTNVLMDSRRNAVLVDHLRAEKNDSLVSRIDQENETITYTYCGVKATPEPCLNFTLSLEEASEAVMASRRDAQAWIVTGAAISVGLHFGYIFASVAAGGAKAAALMGSSTFEWMTKSAGYLLVGTPVAALFGGSGGMAAALVESDPLQSLEITNTLSAEGLLLSNGYGSYKSFLGIVDFYQEYGPDRETRRVEFEQAWETQRVAP